MLGRKDIKEGVTAHHHRDEMRPQQEQLIQEKKEQCEFAQFQEESQVLRQQRRAM